MQTDQRPLRLTQWWILGGVLGLIAAAAIVFIVGQANSPAHARRSAASPAQPVKALDIPAYARAPMYIDDSGVVAISQFFVLPLTDPHSLDNIKACFDGAGNRGIQRIEDDLLHERIPTPLIPKTLIMKAKLCLYEGDFAKASATLREARALMERSPVPPPLQEYEFLIKLQGIAALRRGETENCVECGCFSSCIFPIQPQAVHSKKAGSTEAIQYFTEILRVHPDSIEERWLLNLAHMTLGQYPEGVPQEYRIPLEPFQSKNDIGRFIDIAPELGVNHFSMAGGAIMEDFDGDGRLDIIVSTQDVAGPMTYFRNRGDGTFEDRTKGSGLEKQLGGLYCVQTDYNNDGRPDIVVCRGAWTGVPQRPSLLRNNGDGTFTDVTEQAGLGHPVCSQVAAWADYDNDGFLDLFIGNENGPSLLYHNRGDGTFEEVALRAGVANTGSMCKGASWGDFDGDGYPDLLVSNITGPPRLYHNNRDGTFTDVAAQLGITQPVQGFSCWFWDYDNDGWPDIYICAYEQRLAQVVQSHLGLQNDGATGRLYHNLAGKKFEDVTEASGLNFSTAPMGSNFADFDNDGYLDFYLGTGSPNYRMLIPNRMFKNVEGKRFVDVTLSSGTGHLQKGHGVACGDWDRDGNIDLFEELGGATPGDRFRSVLFQNPGHKNHWVTLKLIGKQTNRPALGARIKITLPTQTPRLVYRTVTTGSSFGGNPFQQTIGIGKATRIESLEITWPTSKTTQLFRNVPIDRALEITESDPTYRLLEWGRIPTPSLPVARQ